MRRLSDCLKHRAICSVLAAMALTTAAARGQTNLLVNPSFELGSDSPSSWNTSGSGSFLWQTGAAHTGSRYMELGGSDFALMYQRADGFAGVMYEVCTWTQYGTGDGTATLKLEFHDPAEHKIGEFALNYTGTGDWSQACVTGIAPTGTALVTASVVGEASGTALFDDVSLFAWEDNGETVSFDVNDTAHEFLGFGAQIFGYGPDENYPDLCDIRRQVLEELNIKYVRIENFVESASWAEMQATRAITDAREIEWVYMIWIAPETMVNPGGQLRTDRIDAFAQWWADEVADLYANNIPVEYIELMNEPDSGGLWSTGITASQYNTLVFLTRQELDNAGLGNVGIVGPGLASLHPWSDPAGYINGLDADGVAAISAWSTHVWASDSCHTCAESLWANFGDAANAAEPSLPKFVTEYASNDTTHHGVTYPHPDDYGAWDSGAVFPYYNLTNTMPYATRVYKNTLQLLNSGAQAPFIWQANDEPTEVNPPGYGGSKRKSWGLVDLWGEPKPVYGSLKTLYPKVPIGAQVITAPDQSLNFTYAAAFVSGNKIIVALANDDQAAHSSSVELYNAPADLEIIAAIAFEQVFFGNPANGEPDVGREVERSITLVPGASGEYSVDVTLPADSSLTIVLGVIGPGDLDRDGDVDLDDHGTFANCLAGPEVSNPPPGCSQSQFDDADSQQDGDVDLLDFVEFLQWFEGA